MRSQSRSTLFAGTACLTLAVLLAGCSDSPRDTPEIDCYAIKTEATKKIVETVEEVIWEQKLYKTDKPIPSKLLRNGNPIPIDEMTQHQVDIFFGWKSDNDAYSDTTTSKLDDLQREAMESSYVKGC